jgi:hypothetical protein
MPNNFARCIEKSLFERGYVILGEAFPNPSFLRRYGIYPTKYLPSQGGWVTQKIDSC